MLIKARDLETELDFTVFRDFDDSYKVVSIKKGGEEIFSAE